MAYRKLFANFFIAFLVITTVLQVVNPLSTEAITSHEDNYKVTKPDYNIAAIYKSILDEENGYIYAYGDNVPGPALIYIVKKSNMSVQAVIDLGGFEVRDDGSMTTQPVFDIEYYNNKVYATMGSKVHVIDIVSKKLVKTYDIGISTNDIAIKDNKLYFYADRYVRILDLATQEQSILNISGYEQGLSNAKLKANQNTNYLYIATDKLLAIDLTSNSLKYTFDDKEIKRDASYAFNVTNDFVYFNNYQLRSSNINVIENMNMINGSDKFSLYGSSRSLKLSDANTSEGIVDVPSSLMKNYNNLLVDNEGNIYNGLTKITFNSLEKPKTKYYQYQDTLFFKKNISKLLMHNDKIYAIANETNSILQINSNTMRVEKELTVGQNPSDITLVGDLLYISLESSNKLSVVDTRDFKLKESIILAKRAAQIAFDGSKLFYVAVSDYSSEIRVLNLQDKSDIIINTFTYSINRPDILVNSDRNILYIGGSGQTSNLFSISTVDYSVVDVSMNNDRVRNFESTSNILLSYNNELFVGNYKLDGSDLSTELGKYEHSPYSGRFLAVNEHVLVSRFGVFDKNTYKLLYDIPTNLNTVNAIVDDYLNIYLLNYAKKTLTKIPTNKWFTSDVLYEGDTLRHTDYTNFDKISLNEEISKLNGDDELFSVSTDSSKDNVSISFPAESYQLLLKRHKLNFKAVSKNGVFLIPMSKSPMTNPSNFSNVIYQFEKLTGLSTVKLKSTLAKLNTELVSNAYRFTMFTDGIYGLTKFHRATSYIERWIPIDNKDNISELVGVHYNPLSNSVTAVPTEFKTDNGQHYAVLKHHLLNGIYALIKTEVSLNDIDNHWAEADIKMMASKRIAKGVSINEFAPNKKVTRAEFLTFIIRSLGLESKSVMEVDDAPPYKSNFNDVEAHHWYAEPVKTAASLNLASGYPDGNFMPNKPINRQEMVAFTLKALAYAEDTTSADIPTGILDKLKDNNTIANWAKGDVTAAIHYGLIGGFPDNTFRPQELATRAQSIAVIKRLMEKLAFIQSN